MGQSKTPSIITEYVNNTDFKLLYPRLTDFDVRYYLFELLKVRDDFFPFSFGFRVRSDKTGDTGPFG